MTPLAGQTSIENARPLAALSENPFRTEIALYSKRRLPGDLHAVVAVPDFYHIALPNIGHQMIERTINGIDGFYASRCYLDGGFSLLRESGDAPDILFLSMSYEGSYIRALRVLGLMGIPLRARERTTGDPLVVIGGRAVTMNPMPFWDIADIIGVGDGNAVVEAVCRAFAEHGGRCAGLYDSVVAQRGVIVPARYRVAARGGTLEEWHAAGAPEQILPNRESILPHSWYLSPETDYNDRGYYDGKTFFSVEIVRACGSRCAFCAEGWNNGAVRALSDPDTLSRLGRWGRERGADLFKLFFPANSGLEPTKAIFAALHAAGLSARVGSAKAEYLDRVYVEMVARFGQEKFALAPETADPRLRLRLGKPRMTDEVLRNVAGWAVEAGIPSIDFYFIANLPGQRTSQSQMMADWIGAMHAHLKGLGMTGRMRVCLPNFFPKAWTPFQYAAAGDIESYNETIDTLESTFGADVAFSTMRGQTDLLSQNICARGGPEVGELMLAVYRRQLQAARERGAFEADTMEMWRSAMCELGIEERTYFDARAIDAAMPWQNVLSGERSKLKHLQQAWRVFSQKTAPAEGGGARDAA